MNNKHELNTLILSRFLILKNVSSPIAAIDSWGERFRWRAQGSSTLVVACQEGDKARYLPKDPRTMKRTETSVQHNQNAAS